MKILNVPGRIYRKRNTPNGYSPNSITIKQCLHNSDGKLKVFQPRMLNPAQLSITSSSNNVTFKFSKKFTSCATFAQKASKNMFCQNKGINQGARWHRIKETENTTEESDEKGSGVVAKASSRTRANSWTVWIEEWKQKTPGERVPPGNWFCVWPFWECLHLWSKGICQWISDSYIEN